MSKNVQIKYRNKDSNTWDEIHPVTKASNVLDDSRVSLEKHITGEGDAGHPLATETTPGFAKLTTEEKITDSTIENEMVTPKAARKMFLKDTYNIEVMPIVVTNEDTGDYSRNNITWIASSMSYINNKIYLNPSPRYSKNILYTSIDNGLTFKAFLYNEILGNDVPFVANNTIRLLNSFIELNDKILNVTGSRLQENRYLVKSTDNGNTWTKTYLPTVPTIADKDLVLCLFKSPSNTLFYSYKMNTNAIKLSELKLYRSTNEGVSWNTVLTIPTEERFSGINSNNLIAKRQYGNGLIFIDNIIFVHVIGGLDPVEGPGSLYRSTDDGITWTKCLSLTSTTTYDYYIYLDKSIKNGNFYIKSNTSIPNYFKSSNQGISWESITEEQYNQELSLEAPLNETFADGTFIYYENGIVIKDKNYNTLGKLSSKNFFPGVSNSSNGIKINDDEFLFFERNMKNYTRITRKNNFFVSY